MEARAVETVPLSAWPVLLALAAVGMLAVGMVVTDLVVERRTAGETTSLVDDALRSVALADRLRADAHALAATRGTPAAAGVAKQIARDAALYEPLARYGGERAELIRVQSQLDRLAQASPDDVGGSDPLIVDVEGAIDRIVTLNERQAAESVAVIHAVQRSAFLADAAAGGVTLVLASIVGTVLVRTLRRQRTLLRARLENEEERRRDLDAFAARVAHDLRGPLSPIRVYAELLRSGGGPPPAELGARIGTGAQRMLEIIDGLLELSVSGRAAGGDTEVRPVVDEVLGDVRPLPADTQLDVAVGACRVRCPQEAFGRIVHNLVSNAIKYRAPERRLELTIAAGRTDGTVELTVADNGMGMDAVAVAHAFDAFYRVHPKGDVRGHGLGLSIVKRTVDALGGECTIASRAGEGTRVTVRLPAAT